MPNLALRREGSHRLGPLDLATRRTEQPDRRMSSGRADGGFDHGAAEVHFGYDLVGFPAVINSSVLFAHSFGE